MADLFDTFTGAAGLLSGHTSDLGDTWIDIHSLTNLSGSGGVRQDSAGSDGFDFPLSSWTPPSADYSVKMVVGPDYPALATTVAFGPVARAQATAGESAPFYYVQYYSSGTSSVCDIIYQPVGSAVTLNTTSSAPLLATGDVLELQVSGSGGTVTLTVLLNGTTVLTATDSTSTRITTAGKVGFRMGSTAGTGANQLTAIWAGAIGGPSEGITPGTASVNYGATQGFSATGGLPNETINWTATSGGVSPSSGTSTTYTAPGSGSSATVRWTSADLPNHTASVVVTLLSAGASTFTLTGPSSGFNHNASTSFTFTPNGMYTGTVTPTMTGLAGTWSPTSLTWSGTATAKTATFTPSASGNGNANGTASPTLTQPASVSYTSNPQTLGVTPGALPTSATTPEIFYGGGTFWLTTPPTFTPTGVAGVSCGTVSVISNTEAHAPITTGTATGTITWTDSTTGATVTEPVAAVTNVLSIVQGLTPGLSTVGYAVYDESGSLLESWTASGVTERGTGSGNYGAVVSVPLGTYSEIRWSVSNAAPFVVDVVNAVTPSTGSGTAYYVF